MRRPIIWLVISALLLIPLFTACSAAPAATPLPAPTATTMTLPTLTPQPATPPNPIGAFESKQYRNLFAELLGKSEAEIRQKIDRAWQQLSYGDDKSQRVYYPVADDMAYISHLHGWIGEEPS
jgi:hypothetical protein